jgi:hypothetical protein
MNKTLRENFNFHSLPQNFFMQNGKVGEGDVFSKKRLYCLNYMNISTKYYDNHIRDPQFFSTKVQQCVLDHGCYSQQHH